MTDILRTLLFLNIQGSVLVILLLLLKGVMRKAFSGKWQRALWLFTAVLFLLPAWKFVPVKSVEPIFIPFDDVLMTEYEELFQNQWSDDETAKNTDTDKESEEVFQAQSSISFSKVALFVWVLGVVVFLLLSFGSYFTYLFKMKRRSEEIRENEIFETVKEKLKIKRKICARKVNISQPPLLTGCFFPVIYMPETKLCEEDERMIYLHELTHYKHKDLPVKWFVCIINAINWFNPCMYFVVKNFNEVCEIYCDEAVTKGMDDEGKRAYMNAILNLVEEE